MRHFSDVGQFVLWIELSGCKHIRLLGFYTSIASSRINESLESMLVTVSVALALPWHCHWHCIAIE